MLAQRTLHTERLPVGIIGMGRVGQLIARRATAFDSTIAYFDVAPRPEVQGKFFSDVISLAEQSDFLIAACPGGPSTHHIINYDVLKALGNTGFVINVSRGNLEQALGGAVCRLTVPEMKTTHR